MRRWGQQILTFLFPAETDQWLSILRVGLGVQIILYCLSLWNDWVYLLAPTGGGLISRNLAEGVLGVESIVIPRVSWLAAVGGRLGLENDTVLWLVWGLLLLSGILLCIGLFSRAAAIAAWFLHLCAVKSGDLLVYGVDNFVTVGLFYLMLAPLPDRASLDFRICQPRAQNSELLGMFRRIVQLHLCLAYFFGGLSKCLGRGWWDGSNIWRALIRPPFDVLSPELLVKWKYLFPALGIGVWVIELGYPFFIWSKRTRLVWLICVLTMHVGIGLFMGMYLFASIMIVLNLAAFGPGLIRRQPDRLKVSEMAAQEGISSA
jgi:uncharacterized membrane protein YphA (DoxX/SURF4 family)